MRQFVRIVMTSFNVSWLSNVSNVSESCQIKSNEITLFRWMWHQTEFRLLCTNQSLTNVDYTRNLVCSEKLGNRNRNADVSYDRKSQYRTYSSCFALVLCGAFCGCLLLVELVSTFVMINSFLHLLWSTRFYICYDQLVSTFIKINSFLHLLR